MFSSLEFAGVNIPINCSLDFVHQIKFSDLFFITMNELAQLMRKTICQRASLPPLSEH